MAICQWALPAADENTIPWLLAKAPLPLLRPCATVLFAAHQFSLAPPSQSPLMLCAFEWVPSGSPWEGAVFGQSIKGTHTRTGVILATKAGVAQGTPPQTAQGSGGRMRWAPLECTLRPSPGWASGQAGAARDGVLAQKSSPMARQPSLIAPQPAWPLGTASYRISSDPGDGPMAVGTEVPDSQGATLRGRDSGRERGTTMAVSSGFGAEASRPLSKSVRKPPIVTTSWPCSRAVVEP